MTPPVVTFAAYSNTGKTTYLEKLIRRLKEFGLRVAVIKHDDHDFQLDLEGKDSQRFAAAGADCVAICSRTKYACFQQRPLPLEEIVGRMEADLILTEGYKYGPYPKIGVYRAASGKGLALEPSAYLAIVSDTPLEAECPIFPLDDAGPLAEYLIRTFCLPAKGCVPPTEETKNADRTK